MKELTRTIKGVFLLEEATFQRLFSAENSMKTGIYLLLACFLIAAIPTFIGNLVDSVQPFTEERADEFMNDLLAGFETAQQFMPDDADFEIFMDQFRENSEFGARIGVAIDALPAPLPYAVGGFLRAFGGWLSMPLAHLASWFSYAVWVLLFAKISGGRGGVNRFLGMTALYAVPNLLSFLAFIPFLGSVFSLVGVVWGWVVYVKGVQVSQEFTAGKAVLVAILPVIMAVVVVFFITLLMGVTIASLVSSVS